MSLNEKIKSVTAEKKSTWLEDNAAHYENRSAKKNARKVALRVLQVLSDTNISQSALAEKMGVSRQQVGKIVKGEENFTFETIDKLEKALGIHLMTIEFGSNERKISREPSQQRNVRFTMKQTFQSRNPISLKLSDFQHWLRTYSQLLNITLSEEMTMVFDYSITKEVIRFARPAYEMMNSHSDVIDLQCDHNSSVKYSERESYEFENA